MSEEATNPASSPHHNDAALLEIPQRFAFHACGACGINFAMPAELYLRRVADAGRIYCPACGNLIELSATTPAKLDALERAAELLAKLRQAEHDNERLKNALARVPRSSAPPVSDEELERRLRHLVNRARHTEYGKVVCRFCEMTSARDSTLKIHLKQKHSQEVAEMPPEFFDQP
jgi:uncharacterized Zn finger protein (UPF0148 family)